MRIDDGTRQPSDPAASESPSPAGRSTDPARSPGPDLQPVGSESPTAARQEWLDRDGQRLSLRILDPNPTAPLVMLIPAMGVPARYYTPFIEALARQGLSSVVYDLRGTGASTPAPTRSSRYGLSDLVDDLDAVLRHPGVQLDGRRVVLLGHSLGGHIALLYLATRRPPAPIAGVVLTASGLPYWRCFGPVYRWVVLGFSFIVNPVSAVVGYWPGIGFGGRQSHGVMRDWVHEARRGRLPHLNGTDPAAGLAAVDVPVLAITVANDRLTPQTTTQRLCGFLKRASVRWHHYDTAEAGGPLDHFRWTRAGEALARRIARFIKELRVPPAS